MKYLLIIVLALSVTAASAQTNPTDFFKKMEGDWNVDVTIRPAPGYDVIKEKGTASFQLLYGGTKLRGEFSLAGANGMVFFSYSEIHQRYEYYQIDNVARSTLLLYGEPDEVANKLIFSGIENLAQWGFSPELRIRWEFHISEDGSFSEEIYFPGPDGEFFLQSTYLYTKK